MMLIIKEKCKTIIKKLQKSYLITQERNSKLGMKTSCFLGNYALIMHIALPSEIHAQNLSSKFTNNIIAENQT